MNNKSNDKSTNSKSKDYQKDSNLNYNRDSKFRKS